MDHQEYIYGFSELKLTDSQIERIIGSTGDGSQQTITDMISGMIRQASVMCSARAEFHVFNDVVFDNGRKSVTFSKTDFDIKKIIYNQLKKSESVAVFLCTAGEEISDLSRQALKEGDPFSGYVYDVIGSEAVEAAADLMQEDLERMAVSQGLKITNRFSPGYCGWHVSEQQKLFRLVPDNFCGIKLNSSSLMEPVKSASGFIGIGEHVKNNAYGCKLCDMKDCIYRKR